MTLAKFEYRDIIRKNKLEGKVKYPECIKKGDIIAVTAPSMGFYKKEQIKEYENAIQNLKKMGFGFLETDNVRTDEQGRSSSAKERAKQFMQVWKDENVASIICAKGGDFACEMLDYLEFDTLKNTKPKWIQGFSDIGNLGFVFTTNLDIATIYSENIRDYGMKEPFENLMNSIKIMQGEEVIQKSFGACEPMEDEREIFESYHLTKKTEWKNLYDEPEVHFSGRCVGGSFDVMMNLIGTKYDKVKEYIEKYKNDGIVWFWDVYERSTPQLFCDLWQCKNAGYFEHCKGIIFGRPCIIREDYGKSFSDVIKEAIGNLKIPIILEADIGHIPPQMPIVNGSILEITCQNGKGEIRTFFK